MTVDLNIKRIGHVVLKVKDLERSVAFYRDTLGMKEVARFPDRMVFFTIGDGNHHDLAVMAVGADAAQPEAEQVGLYHIAFKVGDSIDDLRKAKNSLEEAGVSIDRQMDHTVSQSIYLTDPDGNGLELYVDADPAIWKADPTKVATVAPLSL